MEWESAQISVEREKDRAHRKMRVLILVKTSPQPSLTYGDTVCVAGVALDGPPRWVRLYPIPFRHLTDDKQFGKYNIIEVETRRSEKDQRPESLKVNAESIRVLGNLGDWSKRAQYVEPLATVSMCEVRERTVGAVNAPSLAAIRPAHIDRVTFEPHGPWKPEQKQAVEKWSAQGDLLDARTRRALKPPRLKASIRYHCQEPRCAGHDQGNLDWEVMALQLRCPMATDAELEHHLSEKFDKQMYGEDRSPVLYVGNQQNIARRSAFSVLGTYYPRRTDISVDVPLFDLPR